MAEFFKLLTGYTIHEFAVLDLLASEDRVAAVVVIDAQMPGGGRYRDEEVHLWTLDPAGKVRSLRHYIDTAKHLAAAGGSDTTSGTRGTPA